MVSPSTHVTQFKPSRCKISGMAKKVRLASSTAFGSPVVPLVKIIASGSSAPCSGFPAGLDTSRGLVESRAPEGIWTGIAGIEWRASGRSAVPILLFGATRIALGAVISPKRPIVADGRLPSTMTAIAPSFAQASTDKYVSGPLSETTSTRDPRETA